MIIGKTILITHAKNTTLKGKHGEVIDETKNTFTIKTHNGNKTIIKDQVKIEEQNG